VSPVCALESGPPIGHPYLHIRRASSKSVQRSLHVAVQDRAVAERQRALCRHPGRPHNRRIELDQRHDHQPRSGRRLQQLAQRGNAGWGYADLLPYFKRFEQRIGGGDDLYRGRDGNIPVTDLDWPHEICEAFLAGTTASAFRATTTTTARRSPAPAICSATSTRVCAAALAGCISCRRRRSPAGSMFEPMPAPSRSCSKAGRPWAFAMSTRRAAPSTR